jgi:hypothetical protein
MTLGPATVGLLCKAEAWSSALVLHATYLSMPPLHHHHHHHHPADQQLLALLRALSGRAQHTTVCCALGLTDYTVRDQPTASTLCSLRSIMDTHSLRSIMDTHSLRSIMDTHRCRKYTAIAASNTHDLQPVLLCCIVGSFSATTS